MKPRFPLNLCAVAAPVVAVCIPVILASGSEVFAHSETGGGPAYPSAMAAEGASSREGSGSPAPTSSPCAVCHQPGRYQPEGVLSGEAMDEAMSGLTRVGKTPVARRTLECFPAEPRDLFWKMDQVADGKGRLQPLDFDEDGDGRISDEERNAIRGRNTWLLWGGGNETFWGWLQEQGYGLTDFLILMDSRRRDSRFKTAGLINQPGFKANHTEPLLGLYLDQAKSEREAWLKPPRYDGRWAETRDAQGRPLSASIGVPTPPPNHPAKLFEPGDPALMDAVVKKLPRDGLSTSVYGYPSGVFGLRLFLNPDFFGKTRAAAEARRYWHERVEAHPDRYYTDPSIHADPKLVRPFRVSMSCGFCHVAPHPLNPPADPENPEWENLSSIIGDQYWDPQAAFGNLTTRNSFLYHFLKSQAPGTIDTSLVSTDHINNTNVINAVFDVPARLARGEAKPAERQHGANLLMHGRKETDPDFDLKCPMVLFPGEDSCGVIPALARVPLNIGVYSEQWRRATNLIIGVREQRPFRIAVARANSVYWQTNEKYRVPYMSAFFTLGSKGRVAKSTLAMKLRDARDPVTGPDGKQAKDPQGKPLSEPVGQQSLEADRARRADIRQAGRAVFLQHCAICHSSKQPEGFDLQFARDCAGGWDQAPAPAKDGPQVYVLPMEFERWEAFKRSPAYLDYAARLAKLAGPAPAEGADDPFIEDNFLSNELRIPITLIGVYSGRAMATNAMRGHVWEDYSSETFKTMPSVGEIRYFDGFSKVPSDSYGNNAGYNDEGRGGGPGYFRPPSLISLWATAPYFHNNALGLYNQDPSVKGRLAAYEDGISKLLWNSKRRDYARDDAGNIVFVPPGDLRASGSAAARDDPGYIYRLPQDTHIEFAPGFIRPLLAGVIGELWTWMLELWLWIVLALFVAWLAWKATPRYAGAVLLALAVVAALGIAAGGMGGGGGGTTVGVLLMGIGNLLELSGAAWWLIALALAATGLSLLFVRESCDELARWLVAIVVLGVVVAVWFAMRSWWAVAGVLVIGAWCVWRWCGSLRRFTRLFFITLTLLTLVAGWVVNRFINGRVIACIPVANIQIGPLPVRVGPFPRGTPVNLMMNMDPESKHLPKGLASVFAAIATIKKEGLAGEAAWEVFREIAGANMLKASKCPDFVLDRGHWFGEALSNDDKEALIAFLKTL